MLLSLQSLTILISGPLQKKFFDLFIPVQQSHFRYELRTSSRITELVRGWLNPEFRPSDCRFIVADPINDPKDFKLSRHKAVLWKSKQSSQSAFKFPFKNKLSIYNMASHLYRKNWSHSVLWWGKTILIQCLKWKCKLQQDYNKWKVITTYLEN